VRYSLHPSNSLLALPARAPPGSPIPMATGSSGCNGRPGTPTGSAPSTSADTHSTGSASGGSPAPIPQSFGRVRRSPRSLRYGAHQGHEGVDQRARRAGRNKNQGRVGGGSWRRSSPSWPEASSFSTPTRDSSETRRAQPARPTRPDCRLQLCTQSHCPSTARSPSGRCWAVCRTSRGRPGGRARARTGPRGSRRRV